MTIAATYTKIISLVSGTSGIAFAPEELPLSLSEADLPCALTLVGPATWNEHARGLYRQVRTYTINCYVRPVAEGVVPDEGYKACLTPLYNLGRTFVRNVTLDGEVDHIGSGRLEDPMFNDSGVRPMEFAGRAYHGFSLTLVVTEKAT